MKHLQHLFGTAFLMVLVIGNASSQEQSFGRPILGFTVDTTGASILDKRLDFGFEIRNSVISPEHNYALAERTEDEQILVLKVLEDVPTIAELPALHTGPSLIAVSPRGTAAAFLNRASGFVQT